MAQRIGPHACRLGIDLLPTLFSIAPTSTDYNLRLCRLASIQIANNAFLSLFRRPVFPALFGA